MRANNLPPSDRIRIGDSDYLLHDGRFLQATENVERLLAIFNAVFGEKKGGAWFDWKYRMQSALSMTLTDANGGVVANWSGFPRLLRWKGAQLAAIQNGDVLVRPDARGILTRRGPLFQVSNAFLQAYVGGDRRFGLAFGFPNDRHMRLLEKLDLYQSVFPIRQLMWRPSTDGPGIGWRWRRMADRPSRSRLQQSWNRMALDLNHAVLADRSPDYLDWRFWDHPEHAHVWIECWPILGHTRTYVILRHVQTGVQLLDVIGPVSTFATAVRIARAYAAMEGAVELTAWSSPLVAATIGAGSEATDSGGRFAVARASVRKPGEVRSADWWLTAGDTDFM